MVEKIARMQYLAFSKKKKKINKQHLYTKEPKLERTQGISKGIKKKKKKNSAPGCVQKLSKLANCEIHKCFIHTFLKSIFFMFF